MFKVPAKFLIVRPEFPSKVIRLQVFSDMTLTVANRKSHTYIPGQHGKVHGFGVRK